MKTKILRFLAPVSISVMLLSCEDFIEVDLPQSQLTSESVYQSPVTANAALADIYARLRESGFVSGTGFGGSALLGNYSDDLTFFGGNADIEQFNKHTLLPSNSLLGELWSAGYAQIYAANALIEGVSSSAAITGEDRGRLIGEAIFIRAYIHFYLTGLFGDVPYVTTTAYQTNASIPKTAQAAVYQRVLDDLAEAASLLPSTYPSSERVRVNGAVVAAFRARVFLYIGGWAQAESNASEVIANPDYVWETNPAMVFLKDSPSIIWSLHAGIAGQNTNDAMTFFISDGPPTKPVLFQGLYDAFEPGDLRKELWIKAVTNGPDNYYQAYKYKKETQTPASEEYTILFRLAEQYLIRAEARAHLGNVPGAQSDLNIIRSRAGLPATTANDTPSLLSAILAERRVELFTEQGHRWLDLKRTGSAPAALSAVKPGWKPTDVILPLPASELELNGNLLPQNPGY